MQVVRLLHKRSATALRAVDARRRRTLWSAVEALLRGKKLWLSALGRHLRSKAYEKHCIKRIDRLLGNRHLDAERKHWYAWLCATLLEGLAEPVVLVDWSPLDGQGRLHLLRAALAVGGRALPLYEQVHRRSNDPRAQKRFLRDLHALLGPRRRPIVITDAGFGVDWFEQVEALGWRYVGRILGVLSVRLDQAGPWQRNARLYQRSSAVPQSLGWCQIRQGRPFTTRLHLYARPPKGRVRQTRRGHKSYSAQSQKHQIREAQPWLLASNVDTGDDLAARVVALYRTRMQVEEGFRDLKSARHGFALRENIGDNPQRVANLLLLGALGMLCLWVMGLHGQRCALVRTLQANTERGRAVLSTFFVGRRLLERRHPFNDGQLSRALALLRQHGHAQAFVSTQ